MFSASVYASPTTTSQHLEFLSSFKDSLDLITSNPPTATHGFMGLLKKRGQLKRVYSQNIDNQEARAGLKAVEIEGVKLQKSREAGKVDVKGKGKAKLEGDYVQLHGSIYRVRCSSCDYVAEWTDEAENDQAEGVGEVFRRGEVAECPQCSNRGKLSLYPTLDDEESANVSFSL
jgi:NAD-dependent histone deacetylase SIR2